MVLHMRNISGPIADLPVSYKTGRAREPHDPIAKRLKRMCPFSTRMKPRIVAGAVLIVLGLLYLATNANSISNPSAQPLYQYIVGQRHEEAPLQAQAADQLNKVKVQEAKAIEEALNKIPVDATTKAAPTAEDRIEASAFIDNVPQEDPVVEYVDDGRVALKKGKRHPIPELMKEGKKKWDELRARQSKTFAEAVAEYKRRHKRNPPKGFDAWYAFARRHGIYLVDEFDIISRDFEPYHALTPESIRVRVKSLADTYDHTWGIRVQNGEMTREGELGHHERAKGVVKVSEKYMHLLPDMLIWYNGHDMPRVAAPWEEQNRLVQLARKGEKDKDELSLEYVEKGIFPWWGMTVFCPADSKVRSEGFDYGRISKETPYTGLEMPDIPQGTVGTLVQNVSAYMDVCENPQYRHMHASTSWVYHEQTTPIAPLFTPGSQDHFVDIYAPIIEQFEISDPLDLPFEDRPLDQLHWRGQTSGPYWDATMPWKTTHRARIHLLSHEEHGERVVNYADKMGRVAQFTLPNFMNPVYLDTGLIGPAVQCREDDGTCDLMSQVFNGYDPHVSLEHASLYKFALDIDGNSWSGRFRRLMLSNAAVVKTTLFREFWTDWIVPWVHYIPIQLDYSDMWDVLAFFRGDTHSRHAHYDLAKQIAHAGKEWAKLCYRWEDLEIFQFRLMLEYARIWHGGPDMDYTGPVDHEPSWDDYARQDE